MPPAPATMGLTAAVAVAAVVLVALGRTAQANSAICLMGDLVVANTACTACKCSVTESNTSPIFRCLGNLTVSIARSTLCSEVSLVGTFNETDIPPMLIATTALTSVHIASPANIDFSPLATLPGITTLKLSGNVMAYPAWVTGSTVTELHVFDTGVSEAFFPPESFDLLTVEISNTNFASIESMLQFTNLQKLLVTGNNMLTALPADMSDLSDTLTYLDISGNGLTSIASSIGNLTSLTTLVMEKMFDIATFPSEIAGLTNLENLYFTSSSTTTITDADISGLTRIVELHFDGNALTTLPSNFSHMTMLEHLDISYNELTELSSSLHISSLRRLNAANNRLTTFPDLSGASGLVTLDLMHNKIVNVTDLVPASVESLLLGGNEISDFQQLDRDIHVLGLENNALTDFPSSLLGTQPHLRVLSLSGNTLASIPDSLFTDLPELTSFLCESCGITDSMIPSTLCDHEMEVVVFRGNSLTLIPSTLTECSAIIFLDMSDNSISEVPMSLSSSLSSVKYLDMAGNPSACRIVVDATTLNATFVCDCASNYIGSTYCQSIDEFFYVSTIGTGYADLTVHNPIPNQVEVDIAGATIIALNLTESEFGTAEAAFFSLTDFSILATFDFPVILSAFAETVHNSVASFEFEIVAGVSSATVLDPPQSTVIYPISISYALIEGSCNTTFLTVDSSTSTMNGYIATPVQSCTVLVQATEGLTSEVATYMQLELTVVECGEGTCANGGTCIIDSNQFDNVFTCMCPDGFSGQLCNVASAVAAPLLSSAELVGLGLGMMIVLIIVVLIIRLIYLFISRRKNYHFFISYRQWCDKKTAQEVYLQLRRRFLNTGHRVTLFWDMKSLKTGLDWRDGFMDGLRYSCVYLPLLSDKALEDIKKITADTTKEDNFLLEMEMALQMHRRNRVKILPIAIREVASDGEAIPFSSFDQNQFPDVPSPSNGQSVRRTIAEIMRHQALFVDEGRIEAEDIETIIGFLEDFAWDTKGDEATRFRPFYKDLKLDNETDILENKDEKMRTHLTWLSEIIKTDLTQIEDIKLRKKLEAQRDKHLLGLQKLRGKYEKLALVPTTVLSADRKTSGFSMLEASMSVSRTNYSRHGMSHHGIPSRLQSIQSHASKLASTRRAVAPISTIAEDDL